MLGGGRQDGRRPDHRAQPACAFRFGTCAGRAAIAILLADQFDIVFAIEEGAHTYVSAS